MKVKPVIARDLPQLAQISQLKYRPFYLVVDGSQQQLTAPTSYLKAEWVWLISTTISPSAPSSCKYLTLLNINNESVKQITQQLFPKLVEVRVQNSAAQQCEILKKNGVNFTKLSNSEFISDLNNPLIIENSRDREYLLDYYELFAKEDEDEECDEKIEEQDSNFNTMEQFVVISGDKQDGKEEGERNQGKSMPQLQNNQKTEKHSKLPTTDNCVQEGINIKTTNQIKNNPNKKVERKQIIQQENEEIKRQQSGITEQVQSAINEQQDEKIKQKENEFSQRTAQNQNVKIGKDTSSEADREIKRITTQICKRKPSIEKSSSVDYDERRNPDSKIQFFPEILPPVKRECKSARQEDDKFDRLSRKVNDLEVRFGSLEDKIQRMEENIATLSDMLVEVLKQK